MDTAADTFTNLSAGRVDRAFRHRQWRRGAVPRLRAGSLFILVPSSLSEEGRGWPEGKMNGCLSKAAQVHGACLLAVAGKDDGSAVRPRVRAFRGTNPSD